MPRSPREEIEATINGFTNNKSPGPDGYSSEFYKTLKNAISPTLHLLYSYMIDTQNYFPTGNLAHISVIPKQGKDTEIPSSYRPILLINVDTKIMTKILAEKLATILPLILHKAQAGFTKGRSAVKNIRKTLTTLEYAKRHPDKDTIILTLDSEKAFDNIDLTWLFTVLTKMGIEGRFADFLKTMINNPTASIFTPGMISEPITLYRGTRQGCPISPLLFNLAMEPLTRKIIG